MKNIKFRSNTASDLIAAPLIAVATANAEMQRKQANLLLKLCFTKKKDDTFQPKVVEMILVQTYTEQDDQGQIVIQTVESKFTVPLLTIVPFSSLGVDNVDLTFVMEITGQKKPSNKNKGRTELRANLTSSGNADANSHSNKKTVNVDVHAGPIPLPDGLKTILEIYQKSIQPVSIKQDNNEL